MKPAQMPRRAHGGALNDAVTRSRLYAVHAEPMAKTNFKSVDEYIASQPEAARGVLNRVRSTIRKAVPGTAESIS